MPKSKIWVCAYMSVIPHLAYMTIGVTFCFVPRGVNHDIFEKGLNKWRERTEKETMEG